MSVEMKTLEITYGDVLNIHKCLSDLYKVKGNVYFSFAIAKNIKATEQLIEPLQTSLEPLDDLKEFEVKRKEICEKYCEKDAMGQPIINPNSTYVIKPDNMDLVDEMVNKLKEEYTEAFKDRQKQIDDYNELLLETISVELCTISLEHFPEQISAEKLYALVEHELLV